MRLHSAESSKGWVSQETGGLPLALGEPGVWILVGFVARAPSPVNCQHELRANPRKNRRRKNRDKRDGIDRTTNGLSPRAGTRARAPAPHSQKKEKANLISQTGLY